MRHCLWPQLWHVLILGVALWFGASTGSATTYSSLHVFGDSLSDVGNAWRATLRLIPESPPYYRGRFSNGPVWAEYLASRFRKSGLSSANHAWGGAKARTDRDGIPDLSIQVGRYLAIDEERIGSRPLAAIWAGGNDVLFHEGSGIRKQGRRAADAVGRTARALARTGVEDFLILDLPDLGEIPARAQQGEKVARRASRGSRSFNKRLERRVDELRDRGLRVTTVDIYTIFNALIEDPRAFGVRNVTLPCIDGDGNVCTKRQARRRAFFDDIHPNYVVHREIGAIAVERVFGGTRAISAANATMQVAPVPLPATGYILVAGLAGLALLRRRPRRGNS